jgi:PhnB protein
MAMRSGPTYFKEIVMSQVAPIPAGFSTITPHLVCEGAADAIEFYKKAFGATDMGRMPGPGGKLMHATIQIGNALVMLVDDFPDWGSLGPKALKGSPVVLHLYVEDVDAWYQRAVEAGATAKMPPADMFWGDRYGQVTDPFGHTWSIATHKRDMTPEQMQEEMMKQVPGCPGQ